MTLSQRLRAMLALGRVSNLPTCVSNVLVGVGVAAGDMSQAWSTPVLICLLSVVLLYVGGMVLNDAVDAPRDAIERANRPIPRGDISRTTAFWIAGVLLVGGFGLSLLLGPPAVVTCATLVAAIVAYDVLHKRFAWATPLMGICRALVYFYATVTISCGFDWLRMTPAALAILAYVTLVTIAARREAKPGARGPTGVAALLMAVSLAPAIWLRPASWRHALIAAAVLVSWQLYLVWIARSALSSPVAAGAPPRAARVIGGWVAGISLLDAWLLALLGSPQLTGAALVCFAMSLIAQQRVAGS
ncbi:MAG: UbiA family prenyltransferase [Phycisphaerales bacterium]|nr:UbiA family prenyltransferase [Phycisphaerales bacterium]